MSKASPPSASPPPAGARLTPHRQAVLAHLQAATGALSHSELLAALPQLDKVTLYRTLDWLVAQGLVHRLIGEDRVGRFHAAGAGSAADAHFQCLHCGRTLCLAAPVPVPALPPGFRVEQVEWVIRGRCADCA